MIGPSPAIIPLKEGAEEVDVMKLEPSLKINKKPFLHPGYTPFDLIQSQNHLSSPSARVPT